MPGLNQLKQFASDMENIGDEVKIRAQRGEKPAVVPLPSDVSPDDDSEDFVLGMPEAPQKSDAAQPDQSGGEEESAGGDISVPGDETSTESQSFNIDDLLNPQGAGEDSSPDLSEFLDDDSAKEAENKEPEETPLEDLDLDALLNSTSPSSVEQTPAEEAENTSAPTESQNNAADESTDNVFENPEAESIAAPTESQDNAINESADSGLKSPGEENVATATEKQEAENSVANSDTTDGIPSDDDGFDFDGPAIDLNSDIPEDIARTDGGTEESSPFDMSDFDLPDFDAPPASTSSGSDAEKNQDTTAAESILSGADLPVDAAQDVPAEDFSDAVSAMGAPEEIDFGPSSPQDISDEFPATHSGASSPDDDFALGDIGDFEIPGFSDTETAAFDKRGHPKVDTVDFSQAGSARPKNTLTDEEYAVFKKNLASYPLNLRLAVEDLVVKNEFTDDAVFEVIEKILKKAPARQVAAHLEKMLDIIIDVPRDYERRSVEQYEAYKQSFQYQLKNRIIPGGVAAVVIALVCYVLFRAGVAFIYKPSMARMLYKQGYTLLENSEYPQAESKFIDAAGYKPIKKWFFKFARGYRDSKQYERAAQMYRNILGVFNHDKQGGLEWAEMELYDRANYENAEQIVRRQVLDYHINDSDGMLLLGDVFLEWGSIDSAKYETARESYSDLIQLYGQKDLYMSRMMRYFIRTDKLRNVLDLKNRFYPNKKSLSAADWVELSGYMLDKLYGPLSRSDEYLRAQIEDVRGMLEIAEETAPSLPAPHYNMARYFNNNSNFEAARRELEAALDCFDGLEVRTKKDVYQEIDSCRLLGELYADTREYLRAQESYTRGITLFQDENERTGLSGDRNTGLIYADMGDIEYFVSGDMDAALNDYEQSVLNGNDTASLNYRIGAINYNKENLDSALSSFLKASQNAAADPNLLLALGNTLSQRGDNFAAQGYYSRLLSALDIVKARHLMLYPQEKEDDNNLVEMYLRANNNLGVALYRIASQTGDSGKNAESLVRLSESMRAWDALTRNQQTMARLGGSNLALQNSKYITASRPDWEPAIYTDIPRTLTGEKVLQ